MASPPDAPPVATTPAHFLNLPFELRSRIINYIISLSRAERKPHNQFRTGFEIEFYDFTISAAGLRCHFLTLFNLTAVNRQLREEVFSIIFQNATVCLQVDIPRYGASSEVSASVPGVLRTLKAYPSLRDLAREITVIVHPETPYIRPDLIKVEGDAGVLWLLKHPAVALIIGLAVCLLAPAAGVVGLITWVHRTGPFHGKKNSDLRGVVDTVARGFRSCKHMKIILHLDDFYLQDLKIVLGLLETPRYPITLEEWWIQWHYPPMQEVVTKNYEMKYKNLVQDAIEVAGYKSILTARPSYEEFEMDETHDFDTRGAKIIGKRRRVWEEIS